MSYLLHIYVWVPVRGYMYKENCSHQVCKISICKIYVNFIIYFMHSMYEEETVQGRLG